MINKETRYKVYMKYHGHCFDNLMPSCRRCNHYKRANSLERFRQNKDIIRFATDYLGIKLYWYQAVILYMAEH